MASNTCLLSKSSLLRNLSPWSQLENFKSWFWKIFHWGVATFVNASITCKGVIGLFQLQMRISLPFLLDKELLRFLLIMKTRVFYSPVRRGTCARLVHTWYRNIFHMIAVLIVFLAVNQKKRNPNKTISTRDRKKQIQDSGTISDKIARKIDTQSLLPIHKGPSSSRCHLRRCL